MSVKRFQMFEKIRRISGRLIKSIQNNTSLTFIGYQDKFGYRLCIRESKGYFNAADFESIAPGSGNTAAGAFLSQNRLTFFKCHQKEKYERIGKMLEYYICVNPDMPIYNLATLFNLNAGLVAEAISEYLGTGKEKVMIEFKINE